MKNSGTCTCADPESVRVSPTTVTAPLSALQDLPARDVPSLSSQVHEGAAPPAVDKRLAHQVPADAPECVKVSLMTFRWHYRRGSDGHRWRSSRRVAGGSIARANGGANRYHRPGMAWTDPNSR